MKLGLAAAVSAGLLVAACGGGGSSLSLTHPRSTSSDPTAPTDPSPIGSATTAETTAELKAQLLTVSQFPTGWTSSPVDSSDSDSGTFTCTTTKPQPSHSSEAEADFSKGQLEEFDEILDSYPTPPRPRRTRRAFATSRPARPRRSTTTRSPSSGCRSRRSATGPTACS